MQFLPYFFVLLNVLNDRLNKTYFSKSDTIFMVQLIQMTQMIHSNGSDDSFKWFRCRSGSSLVPLPN